MKKNISTFWLYIETWLAGPLDKSVRYNMRWELASSLGSGVFMAIYGFFPVILRRIGASPEQLALYTTVGYIGVALTGLSLLLIRQGRTKQFMVIFWFLGRAVYLLALFFRNVVGILVIVTLNVLFTSFSGPAYTRILLGIYPLEHRGKVMGIVRLGMALSMILITPVVGWALDVIGYQWLIPAGGLIGSAAIILLTQFRVNEAELPQLQPNPTKYMWNIFFKDKRLRTYLIGIIFFGLGLLIPVSIFPIIQVDRLNLSYTQLSLLNLSQNTAWLLGYFWGGRLIDRVGGVRSLQITFLLSAVSMLPYIWATQGWMILPAFILGGLTSAGVDLGFINALIQLSDPEHIVESSALQSTIIGIRGLIGPFIGVGLLRLGFGYNPVILLGTLCSTIGAALLFRVKLTNEVPD